MITEEKKRALMELWRTEEDDFCSTLWRGDLTPEEEELVNSWDDEFAGEDYDAWADMTDEDFMFLDALGRI